MNINYEGLPMQMTAIEIEPLCEPDEVNKLLDTLARIVADENLTETQREHLRSMLFMQRITKAKPCPACAMGCCLDVPQTDGRRSNNRSAVQPCCQERETCDRLKRQQGPEPTHEQLLAAYKSGNMKDD